jgi:hypothetical protein
MPARSDFPALGDAAWQRATSAEFGPFSTETANSGKRSRKIKERMGTYDVEFLRYEVLARATDGSGRAVWYDLPGQRYASWYVEQGFVSRKEADAGRMKANAYNLNLAEQFVKAARAAGAEAAEAARANDGLDAIARAAVEGKAQAEAEAAERSAERAAEQAGKVWRGEDAKQLRLRRVLQASGKVPSASEIARERLKVQLEEAGLQAEPEEVLEAADGGALPDDVINALFPLPSDPLAVSTAINTGPEPVYNFFMQLRLRGVI